MKYFILSIFIIYCASPVNAQADGRKAERIQALKIAFITQRLQLSSEEAQRFWPIYNNYEKDLKLQVIANKGGDVIDNEEKMLNIRKQYRLAFISAIGQPKTHKLFTAEKDFRGALLRKLRNPQNQQRQLNRPNL